MTRTSGALVENNFNRALITEVTAVNSPENSVLETFDCRFHRLGNVTRRLGYEYETDYVVRDFTRNNSYIKSYLWEGADEAGNVNIAVFQVGTSLFFFKEGDGGPLSGGYLDTISLNDFQVTGSTPTNLLFADFASGKDALWVVHPSCEPFYVKYNVLDDSLTTTQISLETRDIDGIPDDSLEIDERQPINKAAASSTYLYNMYNKGWYIIADCGGVTENVLDNWDNNRSDLPSYADVWWSYKDADGHFEPVEEPDEFALGNSPAPTGHYIYSAFQTTRADSSGFSGLQESSSGGKRPATVAFYASRVFYAGVDADGYSTKIYFSQILSDISNAGKCYQRNDPTSELLFDLLPNDGGVIDIPDVGRIVKMEVIGNFLCVFSTKGIWTISGTDLTPFKADDFAVDKLPYVVSCSSKESFVNAQGVLMFWAQRSVFSLLIGDNGLPQVTDIGLETVKTFIENIPVANLDFVQGAYNKDTKIIQWLYKHDTASTVDENFDYTRILNFDITTAGFYPWTIPVQDEAPRINTLIPIGGTGFTTSVDDVVDNSGVVVTDEAGASLDEDFTLRISTGREFLYLTSLVTTEPIVEEEDFTIEEYTFLPAVTGSAPEFEQALTQDDIVKVSISFLGLTGSAPSIPEIIIGGYNGPSDYHWTWNRGGREYYDYDDDSALAYQFGSPELTFYGMMEIVGFNEDELQTMGWGYMESPTGPVGSPLFHRNSTTIEQAIKFFNSAATNWNSGEIHMCVWRSGRDQSGGGTQSVMTFATEKNPLLKDWEIALGADAIDYTSYFLTQHKIHGDIHRRVTLEYLDIVSLKDDTSGGTVQTRFDWSNNRSSGKWSRQEKIYLTKTHRDYVRRRVRLRGHGHAFQLYVESESMKPFDIHGWALWETGNANL